MSSDSRNPVYEIADDIARSSLSRRRFLGGAVGLGGLALMPDFGVLRALAAPPLGAKDGVLVVIDMAGGNDGLNTLVPVDDGRYYSMRQWLAIDPAKALPVAPGYGLHPALVNLKRRYDAGDVAVVRGIGAVPPSLSHFNSMDTWKYGWGGAGLPPAGWLGRYLDGLPDAANEALYGVAFGHAVPLELRGVQTAASLLPMDITYKFGVKGTGSSDVRMYQAIASAGGGTSLGEWPDRYGRSAAGLIELIQEVKPVYESLGTTAAGTRDADLCAQLINQDLGVRVFEVGFGSFDTHTQQAWKHGELLGLVDAFIERLFTSLDAQWQNRVAVMTFSEFGRRPTKNGDDGTDHGTSSVAFVVGSNVRGGLHGAQPSLANLDASGNQAVTVDFRQMYSSVLSKWLRADDRQILGAAYTPLDLFAAGPGEVPTSGPTTTTVATTSTTKPPVTTTSTTKPPTPTTMPPSGLVVVDFDQPAPPGVPGDRLQGRFGGINFGGRAWRWNRNRDVNPTNHIHFAGRRDTRRRFAFVDARSVLVRIRLSSPVDVSVLLQDAHGEKRVNLVANVALVVETGWTRPSDSVTISSTAQQLLSVDNITHRIAV